MPFASSSSEPHSWRPAHSARRAAHAALIVREQRTAPSRPSAQRVASCSLSGSGKLTFSTARLRRRRRRRHERDVGGLERRAELEPPRREHDSTSEGNRSSHAAPPGSSRHHSRPAAGSQSLAQSRRRPRVRPAAGLDGYSSASSVHTMVSRGEPSAPASPCRSVASCVKPSFAGTARCATFAGSQRISTRETPSTSRRHVRQRRGRLGRKPLAD